MPSGKFVSLFLGILEPRDRTLRYASAGHCPPYVWRRGMPLLSLEKSGPVLGVMEGFSYGRPRSVVLAPGDVLVLYTDGTYEAKAAAPGPDGSREMFGEERWQDAIARRAGRGEPAGALLEGLLADVDAFARGGPADDDVTCVVLRVAGDAAAP
jgi:sigma-B regulation protein RsbU (phosphoserine phosphatase)